MTEWLLLIGLLLAVSLIWVLWCMGTTHKRLWSPWEEDPCGRPHEDYAQCSFPKDQLRVAAWEIDGKKLCTQHAGLAALEHLS